MSVQDPATHARDRNEDAMRYDEARRSLASSLKQRPSWIDPRNIETPMRDELRERQARVMEAGVPLVAPLTRYVEQQLEQWEANGVSVQNTVSPDDVVTATFIAAIDDAVGAPLNGAFYSWLRRLARRQVREAVLDATERQLVEQSLDDTLDTDRPWPAPVVHLIDTLEDPHEALPEAVLVHDEARQLVYDVLARLPERWRESFLLRDVDGWSIRDVARAEGLAEDQAAEIIVASRAFLREWLRHDLGIGTAAQVE